MATNNKPTTPEQYTDTNQRSSPAHRTPLINVELPNLAASSPLLPCSMTCYENTCDFINLAATLSSAAVYPIGARYPTPSSNTIAAAIRAAAPQLCIAGVERLAVSD